MSIYVHNGDMTTVQAAETRAEAGTASAGAEASTEAACAVPACGPERGVPLGPEEAQGKAQLFKALADANRLRLLSMVKASDGGEACVCDLTGPLDLGQPTVSHHLKILVDAGLLHREKRGTWAYYSLVPGALDHIASGVAGL
jgi:ArsR family transcriptional regulator, arsenate/arsenite/antimonite-responsive transcriptional repressor